MHCDQVREGFSDLMDGFLDQETALDLESHLEHCAHCAREWGRFRRTVDAVRGLPQRAAPPGFAGEVRARLERSQLLQEPDPPAALKRRGRLSLLVKVSAAAAVILVAVHWGRSPQSVPASRERVMKDVQPSDQPRSNAEDMKATALDQMELIKPEPPPAPVLLACAISTPDLEGTSASIRELLSPGSARWEASAQGLPELIQAKELMNRKILAESGSKAESEAASGREAHAAGFASPASPASPGKPGFRVLSFRLRASEILDEVRRGRRMVLTYRGRPAIRLEPISDSATLEGDPFYRLADLAETGARGLSNEEIDEILYGS